MKLRWFAFAVVCMIAAGLARGGGHAAKKPNFSGTWVLNMHQSRLGMPAAPVASTWVIEHHEPKFHLQRTHVYRSGFHDTWSIDLLTDGKHETIQHDGPYREATRMYWAGKVLVFDMTITTSNGTAQTSEGKKVVRYSLSADGKTLTAIEHDENPGGKWSNRWVFHRQATQKRHAHMRKKAEPVTATEANKKSR